jgi:hypothetical protein
LLRENSYFALNSNIYSKAVSRKLYTDRFLCLIFYGSSGEERQLLNGFLDFIEKDKLLFGDG